MSQNQAPGWNQPPGGPPPPPPNQIPSWGAPPPYGGAGTKLCIACGSVIDSRASMCPRCGVQQPPVGAGKSRVVAAFLALLLGGFGVHRFYLGNIALGILYLLFVWTAIPSFIAWLETFYFLTRSNEDWARTYGGPVTQPNGVGLGCAWILALLPLVGFVVLILGAFVLADGMIDILSEWNEQMLSSIEAGS